MATLIPTLGGTMNWGRTINAAGHVTGYSYLAGDLTSHAFLFAAGVTTDLGTLGGAFSAGLGVNRHGQVVGNFDDGGLARGFLYSGGVMQRLPMPAGLTIDAAAINDRGQIAGTFSVVPFGTRDAYLLVNGVFTDLVGLESSGGSWSQGINNKGDVTGTSYVAGGNGLRAFQYSNGVMQDIGLPGPLVSQGFGINDQGQVTGSTELQADGSQAFIATNGVITVIGALEPLGDSGGYGINSASQVVGQASLGSTVHGFLYDSGVMYDLNALVINGLGGREIIHGASINDSGQIVAIACNTGYTNCRGMRLDPYLPGTGTISANPYGPIAVTGGTLVGSTLTLTNGVATLQLGTTAGATGSLAVIDFEGINLAPGTVLTVRSGAPGQTLVLGNLNVNATTVAGSIVAVGGNGAPPPALVLRNARGIAVATEGRIVAPSGLVLDALASTWTTGQGVLNHGIVDGGSSLRIMGAAVNGGGAFKGNTIEIATFGDVKNPVNGAHFLANGLALAPSTGGLVALTLNAYGPAPQFINVAVQGDTTLSMPSSWPTGVANPVNNSPVLPGQFRPAGVPDPAYGGGSMIVQATGTLNLDGGVSHDFVFPGGVVLKAGAVIDFNGVTVDNGWTTSGKAFQGQFFEAPVITSNGPIDVRTSDLNWMNFSVHPVAPVRAWRLVRLGNGAAQFSTADSAAPHINTYSILIEAAAVGNCWVCLMDLNPANLY